jgi:hypothetical protein
MKKILLLLGLIFTINSSYSQNTDNTYWVNLGGGNYSSSVQSKGIIYLSLNADIDKAIFKLRLITHEEMDFVIFSPPPKEVFNSVGLMLGRVHKQNNFQIQFTGGIGIVSGQRR